LYWEPFKIVLIASAQEALLEKGKSNGVCIRYTHPATPVTSLLKKLFLPKDMGAAIGFAIILIVFGIFLPDVLSALAELFLILVEKATIFVSTL
jgi:hypothetical protein